MIFSGEEITSMMDDLKAALVASMDAAPEDFDGREALWMAREDLREEQHARVPR